MAARRSWPDRVKELRTTKRQCLAALLAFALAAVVFAAMPRPYWPGVSPARFAFTLLLYGLALAACTRALLAPLSLARRSAALSVTIAVGVGLPLLMAVWPSTEFHSPIAHWGKRSFGCFAFGTMFGTPFLMLLWLLDRAGLRSHLTGSLAVVALGLVGNIALVLHCALIEPLHLVVGHAAISIVWLAVWVAVRRAFSSLAK